MPERKKDEEKLEMLSQLVSEGWAKSHPVPESLQAQIRETVAKQLAEEKQLTEEQRQERVQEEAKRSRAEEQAHQIEEQRRQERSR